MCGGRGRNNQRRTHIKKAIIVTILTILGITLLLGLAGCDQVSGLFPSPAAPQAPNNAQGAASDSGTIPKPPNTAAPAPTVASTTASDDKGGSGGEIGGAKGGVKTTKPATKPATKTPTPTAPASTKTTPASSTTTPTSTTEDNLKFIGIVETISPTTWMVDGTAFTVTEDSDIEEGLGMGDSVLVRYRVGTNGSRLVKKIELDD